MSFNRSKDCPLCDKAHKDEIKLLNKRANTKFEIILAAASGEDVESLSRRLRTDKTNTYEPWSIHAVGTLYWKCDFEIKARAKDFKV